MIAPSFGEIFYNNSLKNGLLPIVLAETEIDSLFHDVDAFPGLRLVVDLEQQSVSTMDGGKVFRFDIDPSRKHSLLNGLDEIGATLQHAEAIKAFEEKHMTRQPWLYS